MINVIIFDLDGVLVDTKNIHFDALNSALKKYKSKTISYNDHIKVFDGLPTSEKLKILISKQIVKKDDKDKIKKEKDKITTILLKKKNKEES